MHVSNQSLIALLEKDLTEEFDYSLRGCSLNSRILDYLTVEYNSLI